MHPSRIAPLPDVPEAIRDLFLQLAGVEEGRPAAARAFAEHVGAEAFFALVRDPEVGALVPAPGFPQSLPGGPGWRAFLESCAQPGRHHAEVAFPDAGTLRPASALVVPGDGTAFVFVAKDTGGLDALAALETFALPLLGAVLRAELSSRIAGGRAAAERESARQAHVLTAALDRTRTELEHAISEQRLARERAEASRGLLQTVVDQMPAGVVIAEAPTGRMLLANHQVERLLGYPAVVTASIEDHRKYTAVHADGRPFTAEEYPLVRALLGETVMHEELLLIHGDGSRRVLSASAAPVLDPAGNRVAAVAAFTDVTERHRIEEDRLRLLRESEAANQAKDEFLAMLGHELRNPLAPIATAVQLLKLRAGGIGSREHEVIERQVNHLTRLVDDLLDVSRITRGKVQLKKEPIDLAQVVARAVELASPLLEQRRHRFSATVPPEGMRLEGDEGRLAQVLSNLLTNAARYTPPGGEIVLAAERVFDEIVLSVRDNGIGIEHDMLPRVFDLFIQGKRGIDRAEGGLGLGLALVKNLVEMHGGTVSAHSAGRDRGSEFVVCLPALPLARFTKETPALPLEVPVAAPNPKKCVLVVDDNVDAADLLGDFLSDRGHEVVTAHDGPAALYLAAGRPIEVAVLDLGLPVMDGYELAQRLRASTEGKKLRIIALTGYGQDADRARTHAAGFDVHLVKPVNLKKLVAAIDDEPAA